VLAFAPFEPGQEALWDGFVESRPEARFYHLTGYSRAIEETYGLRPAHTVFSENGRVWGLLPALVQKRRLGGGRLVSLPFAEYGGPLIDSPTDRRLAFVVGAARTRLQQLGLKFLEMHAPLGLGAETMARNNMVVVKRHGRGWVSLEPAETLWDRVSRQARKAVRKARTAGLVAMQENDLETVRQRFYPLYFASMKRLGSPPHPLRFYEALWKYLGDRMHLVVVSNAEGCPVAALLGFSTGGTVLITNTVSDPAYWPLRPNDLAHWSLMEWAAKAGFAVFDFGVVRYASQAQFKAKWDIRIEPYVYAFVTRNGSAAAPATWDSSSRKARVAQAVWRAAVPAWGAGWLGPKIRRALCR